MELLQIPTKTLIIGIMITLLVLISVGQLGFYVIALFFKNRESIGRIRKLYLRVYYLLIILTFMVVMYE